MEQQTKGMDQDIVMLYSDGSCNNKTHQKGGYGIVLKWKGEVREYFGGRFDNTTSARMEILGAIKAIEMIKPTYRALLHSDSEYVVNAINKGWLFSWQQDNFQHCKNSDLWRKMYELYKQFPKGYLKFKWVKGHAGLEENERCDRLANQGANHDVITEDDRNLFSELNKKS